MLYPLLTDRTAKLQALLRQYGAAKNLPLTTQSEGLLALIDATMKAIRCVCVCFGGDMVWRFGTQCCLT